ncbi:MAG: LLM class flavin-dependent oxidoreductase [Gammaproteobacteria bacterium]|nr:LLM class flavin-dependent oxidoreductase [Gammaproteobacteria bacterium]
MKFSLVYELQMPKPWTATTERDTYMQAIEQIKLADEMGFDIVWAVEHHFLTEYSHSSAPEVFLSAVSQHTKRIRIGHGVVLLPFNYNHPIRAAEKIAALDIVSNGRVEFGSGRSTTSIELGGFNVNPDDSREQWEEGLEVVLKAWRDGPLQHEGKHLSIPAREVWPKPIQKPHPPLWMAGTAPDTFRVAGNKGLGVLCFQLTPDGVAQAVKTYRAAIANPQPVGGFINNQFASLAMTLCSREPDTVELGVGAARWFLQKIVEILIGLRNTESNSYAYLKDMIDLSHQPKDASIADLDQHPFVVAGDPAKCIRKLEFIESLGIDQFICFSQMGGIPHHRVMESIRLYGEEIIPYFKAKEAAGSAKVASGG